MRLSRIRGGSVIAGDVVDWYNYLRWMWRGSVGNCEWALCLGMNKVAIGSFLGAPCPPVGGCASDLGGERVDGLLSIAELRLETADDFGDGSAIPLALGGENGRGFTAWADIGGSIELPYTKRWILMDSARVFSIRVLGLLDPGLTEVKNVWFIPRFQSNVELTACPLGRR